MRIERIVLLVSVLLFLPATTRAQNAWRASHTGGQPLLVFTTPPLTPGLTYEFETGGTPFIGPGGSLVFPDLPTTPNVMDTVISLLDTSAPGGSALAGADGCSRRGQIRASCFQYTIPTSYGTSPLTFDLLVRPYITSMSGTTSIRIQQVGSGAVADVICGGQTNVTTGCWFRRDNLSFGAAMGFVGNPSPNYHFETRERPGATSNFQMLAFAPSNVDWHVTIAAWSNHSNYVGGTVELLGPLPAGVSSSSTVFAGAFTGASTIDLVRNDFGRLSATTSFGADTDGDGLGASLESVLQTCDGPTGAYCTALVDCAYPPRTTLCTAALRDSDRDGFEDNLEFYGYQNGIDNLSNMGRFGANPARYDVFWEADTGDTTAEGASCTYSDEGYFDWYEAMQAATMYASPSSASPGGFVNPDGSVGIALHTDLAPPPAGALAGAPSNDNPSYGVWGGASCVRYPTCSSDAECEFAGVPGVCEPAATAGARRACSDFNSLALWQTNQRRWLFRHGMTYPGAAGRVSKENPLHDFSAGGAPEAAHEVGHLGTLGHSGPAQNYATEMNYSPLHLSTMNYRFSYMGFAEDTDGLTSLPALNTSGLQAVAFSAATSVTDQTAMTESCVFGATAGQTITGTTVAVVDGGYLGFPMRPSGSCWDVDWDRDGVYLPAGQTTTGSTVWQDEESRKRRRVGGGTRWMRMNAAAEIVVSGAVTRVVRNQLLTPTSGGTGQLTVSRATSFVCTQLPQAAPADRYPACDFEAAAVSTGLLEGATPVSATSFTACDITDPNGGDEAMLVVWRTPGNVLRWGRMGFATTTGVLNASGAVTGATPRTTDNGTELLGVARTASGAVLVYRNPVGALVEQSLSWSGTAPSWTAPVTLSSTIWTGMNGSAGLTHVYGTTDFAAGPYMAVQTGTSMMTFYRRTGTAAWAAVGTSSTPAAVLGQPTIEIGVSRPRAGVATERLHVFARFLDRPEVQTRDSDLHTANFSSPRNAGWILFDGVGARTMSVTAMARDTQRAPYGLRGVDYDLVGNAVVLGAQASGPNLVSCPFGSPVTAGTKQVCFSGGLPVGVQDGAPVVAVIDCSTASPANPTATSGACPAGYACQAGSNISVCALNGFIPMNEERAPAVDGVIPGRIEQQNEWPQMRSGYCWTGRALRTRSFTPSAFAYPRADLPGVTAAMICPSAPPY